MVVPPVFEMDFQSVKVRGPQLAVSVEPVVELGQGLRANAVKTALRVGASLDDSCVLEDPQVF
jgi:hypothetical protein